MLTSCAAPAQTVVVRHHAPRRAYYQPRPTVVVVAPAPGVVRPRPVVVVPARPRYIRPARPPRYVRVR
ncbi:hypothetical protein [Hymenobacter fastidiosus]|uniref:hypothetical protein n=1 Tax=Hymenobacter fastidiosus TaxID=486264 RepID=UPI0031F0BCC0